jgi:hypothetical protein
MPTELPPPKKPIHTPNGSPDLWLTRTLNWLAVIVGIGLCLYAMNYGISSPSLPNSPSASVSTKG